MALAALPRALLQFALWPGVLPPSPEDEAHAARRGARARRRRFPAPAGQEGSVEDVAPEGEREADRPALTLWDRGRHGKQWGFNAAALHQLRLGLSALVLSRGAEGAAAGGADGAGSVVEGAGREGGRRAWRFARACLVLHPHVLGLGLQRLQVSRARVAVAAVQ